MSEQHEVYEAEVSLYGGRQFRAPFPTEEQARAWVAWLTSFFTPITRGQGLSCSGVQSIVIRQWEDYLS